MDEAKRRHQQLCRDLAAHDYRYHVLDDPQISDAEYDALYRELRELEAARPDLVTADSPTQRVGASPRVGFETVPHVVPMMSLDNTYDADDVKEFVRRVAGGLREGATARASRCSTVAAGSWAAPRAATA
jgi:DNA ligase (NAD+)